MSNNQNSDKDLSHQFHLVTLYRWAEVPKDIFSLRLLSKHASSTNSGLRAEWCREKISHYKRLTEAYRNNVQAKPTS